MNKLDTQIREIQLNLLEDWLGVILKAKEKNPKAVADTLITMEKIDKSIVDIKQALLDLLPEEKEVHSAMLGEGETTPIWKIMRESEEVGFNSAIQEMKRRVG